MTMKMMMNDPKITERPRGGRPGKPDDQATWPRPGSEPRHKNGWAPLAPGGGSQGAQGGTHNQRTRTMCMFIMLHVYQHLMFDRTEHTTSYKEAAAREPQETHSLNRNLGVEVEVASRSRSRRRRENDNLQHPRPTGKGTGRKPGEPNPKYIYIYIYISYYTTKNNMINITFYK